MTRGAPSRADAAGERFAALDGVRGLAALMVALSHFTLAFEPALLGGGERLSHFAGDVATSHTAAVVLANPELGVAIFFVLSGFVLTASLHAKPAGLAELAARRWVRLSVPICGTSLLIWLLIEFHLFRSIEAAPLAGSDWLAMNYVWPTFESNSLARLMWQSFVDVYLRARAWYNVALWTMPIEFWGSLALFAAYRLGGAHLARPWVALLAALGVLAAVWRTNYCGFPCGVALFEARRLWLTLAPSRRVALGRVAGPVGAGLLIVGLLLGGQPYNVDLPGGGPYARLALTLTPFVAAPVTLLHRLGAVALVGCVLVWRPARTVLTTRPVQWLGRVSFMVYLCHVPIICSVVAGGLLLLAPHIGYNPAIAVLLVVFLAVLAAASEVTTRAFDAPAMRWSRNFGRLVGDAAMIAARRVRAGSPVQRRSM